MVMILPQIQNNKLAFNIVLTYVFVLSLPYLGYTQNVTMTYEESRIITGGYELPEYKSESSDSLLNSFLEEAYHQSDALKAAYQSWVAVRSQTDQVGSLPDPEVMFRYFINPMKYDGPFAQGSIGVMQMFPWFGTLDENRNYVNLLSHAKWQEVDSARLEVFEGVKTSWYRLVLVHRRKEYLKEHLEWVNRLMQLTRSRVESGYASRSDMLQLEMEKIEIETMLEALNISFSSEQMRFNSLLNRNATQEVTLPTGRPEITWELTYEETLNLAITHNPSILNLEILDQAGESMEKRAKLEGYPMIGVGAEIMGRNSSMQMDGNRIPIYANVTIRLPIWRKKYKAILSQAQAERKVIEYEISDKIRSFQAEISSLMSVYKEADVRVKRYRDALLPKSRELTDLLLLDYSNARIRLDEVIQMRRRSVEYATMLEEAIFDRNMATVSLQRFTAGVEF
ncbi:MAG TPA: hypothetical protein DCE78_02890 [Bacteroidetes bacterium]|nr:hypothetical protein [Bacteroidota bacterium]